MRYPNQHGSSIKGPAPSNKFSTLRIILVILLITNLVSFIVWQNIKGLDLDKQILNLERNQLDLHHIYNKRLIEYEKIRRSVRIKNYAINQLGMTESKKENIIFLGIKEKEILQQMLMLKESKK